MVASSLWIAREQATGVRTVHSMRTVWRSASISSSLERTRAARAASLPSSKPVCDTPREAQLPTRDRETMGVRMALPTTGKLL